jgi:NADPH:quinone reductase-like Zn-dependent oxidoreductase
MRAVIMRGHGGPDVLNCEEVATPKVGAGEVLIRLETAGINRFDMLVRSGNVPNASVKFPHVLGVEGAGTVAAVGDSVSAFKVGQRVVPILTVSLGICDKPVCYCAQGHDNICAKFDKLGHTRWGTYAEYVLVNQFGLLPLPDRVSFLDASAALVAFATAWELIKKANLRAEDTVLVNAAGGAVGSAAVQIGRLLGARVIASAGSDDKLDRARQMGADAGINYTTAGLAAAARELTGGRGVDVVIEGVGGEILRQSLEALAYNGRCVTAGSIAPTETAIDIRKYMVRSQITLTGSHFTPKESIKEVLRLLARGALRPVLARTFPLAQARQAHELLESRNLFGNIVLEI